jgi:hypothetical protein
VKLLGRGEYVVVQGPEDKGGHFGLGMHNYAHSTAPNRRFPDLVTQRIAQAAIDGAALPYSVDELAAIAARCSEREAAAQKVERLMRKVQAATLFGDRIGQVFDAVVTGRIAQRHLTCAQPHPPWKAACHVEKPTSMWAIKCASVSRVLIASAALSTSSALEIVVEHTMKLPPPFIETICGVHGAAGNCGCTTFDVLIRHCEEVWSLQVLEPFPLSYNFVAPVVFARTPRRCSSCVFPARMRNARSSPCALSMETAFAS